MADSKQDLRDILSRPRESLGLELKRWIDPNTPEGKAKIARGCIALRNNDGGRLVIGFKDDGTPDAGNAPSDVRAAFHPDVIQGIVSKYSAEAFAVDVSFVQVDGQDYPIITAPAGVRTPVAAKADLPGRDRKLLIKEHAVYVRSLTSSNTFSTSEARRGDWELLSRICFNNREADIGAFVRRHLAALNLKSLAELIPAFAGMLHEPTSKERIVQELERGRKHLADACRKRALSVPDIGFRESSIIVDGMVPEQAANAEFRDRLLRNATDHSGWPPFVDLSAGGREVDRPYPLNDGWQALVTILPPEAPIFGHQLDFWRIESRGVFYHLRGLEDDLNESRGVAPGLGLDFLLQVGCVTEIVSKGLSFARSLGCKEDGTSLIFGFRWTKLEGRILTCWTDPRRRLYRQPSISHQDEYLTPPTVVPLETPPAGIAPHVENAVKGLFNLFAGTEFPSQVIQDIVDDTVKRRV